MLRLYATVLGLGAVSAGCATTRASGTASREFLQQVQRCRVISFRELGQGVSRVHFANCVVDAPLDVPEFGTIHRYRLVEAYASSDATQRMSIERPAEVEFNSGYAQLPESLRPAIVGASAPSELPVSVKLPWPGQVPVSGATAKLLPADRLVPAASALPSSSSGPVAGKATPAAVSWCDTTPKTFRVGEAARGGDVDEGPRVFGRDCGTVVVRGRIAPVTAAGIDVVAVPVASDGTLSFTFTAAGHESYAAKSHVTEDGGFALDIEARLRDVGARYVFATTAPSFSILQRDGAPFVFELREGPTVDVGILTSSVGSSSAQGGRSP